MRKMEDNLVEDSKPADKIESVQDTTTILELCETYTNLHSLKTTIKCNSIKYQTCLNNFKSG